VKDAVAILQAAKETLIEGGWIQGKNRGSRGRCAWGAILHASKMKCVEDAAYEDAAYEAARFLAQTVVPNLDLPFVFVSLATSHSLVIAMWNDRQERRFNEVMAHFRPGHPHRQRGNTMSLTVEVLQKAKEVLIEDGWIQGAVKNKHGRCAWGAINYATVLLGRQEDGPTVDRAVFIFEKTVSPGGSVTGIGVWNDQPWRTFQEVMAQFDQAILLAKEHEARQHDILAARERWYEECNVIQ
jgi:hypothetical protein